MPRGKTRHTVDGFPMFDLFERAMTPNERMFMRKLLILAILAVVVLTGFEARAAQRRVRQVSSGQGPVQALVDLERRKNAALRQMFFGR